MDTRRHHSPAHHLGARVSGRAGWLSQTGQTGVFLRCRVALTQDRQAGEGVTERPGQRGPAGRGSSQDRARPTGRPVATQRRASGRSSAAGSVSCVGPIGHGRDAGVPRVTSFDASGRRRDDPTSERARPRRRQRVRPADARVRAVGQRESEADAQRPPYRAFSGRCANGSRHRSERQPSKWTATSSPRATRGCWDSIRARTDRTRSRHGTTFARRRR